MPKKSNESFYKGHKIIVSSSQGIDRQWTYTAWIDQGVAMKPDRTFNTQPEALDAAVQYCEDRIENPLVGPINGSEKP